MRKRYANLLPLLAVTVILPQSAWAQDTKAMKAQSLSDTGEASAVVKISCAPETFPLTGQSLAALLNSAGVRVAASQQVFHDPGEGGDIGFDVVADTSGQPQTPVAPGSFGGPGFGWSTPGAGPPPFPAAFPSQTIVGTITVSPGRGAVEYLQAVCDRLEAALVAAGERERQQLEQRLQTARGEAEAASKHFQELQTMRREFCKNAGRADLAREAIVDEIRHLEQERLDLEMQQVSRQARREAIEKRIARIKESPDARGKAAEEVLRAAQTQLAALREKQKELAVKFKHEVVPAEEVRDAEAQIAEAEARVAEAKGKLEEVSSGGERVAELNQILADQAVDEAEMEARLRWLEDRLGQSRGALELADEYERTIEVGLPLAREAYEQSRMMVAELERRVRTAQPPTVMVLGR